MIAHIVLFEPVSGLSTDDRRSFLATLRRAVRVIPGIRRARIGKTQSIGLMPTVVMGHNTYSYGAILEFADEKGLRGYLEHPEHEAVRAAFWKACQATLIADVRLAELDSAELDDLVV